MSAKPVTTQARVNPTSEQTVLLDAYAEAFGVMTRRIWKHCFDPRNLTPRSPADLEAGLRDEGWSRREVRSAVMRAGAAQASVVENRALELAMLDGQIEETERRLDAARRSRARVKGGCRVKSVVKRAGQCHGLGRKLDRLMSRRADAILVPPVPLWGSRRLFNAQHHLEANGLADHGEWLSAWRRARSNFFMVQGDKDAAGGNAEARIRLVPNGAVIELTIPSFLRHLNGGNRTTDIAVAGFRNHRKHLEAAQAIDTDRHAEQVRKFEAKEPSAKGREPSKTRPRPAGNAAITVSFTRNTDWAWTASATVQRCAAPKPATKHGRDSLGQRTGALGVDINPDHLAWCIINSDGNPTHWGKISVALAHSDGTPIDSNQAEAVIGDAIAELVDVAIAHGRIPIVSEDLDFTRARHQQAHQPKRLRRLLNGFNYRTILTYLAGRCIEHGIENITINPAWTSVLGQINYAAPHGVSVDQAAACVIARRGLGFKNQVRPTVTAHFGPEDPKPGTTATKVARNTGLTTLAGHLPPRRSTWGTHWLTRTGCRPEPGPDVSHTSTRHIDTLSGHRAPQRPAARPRPSTSTRTRTGQAKIAVANHGQPGY